MKFCFQYRKAILILVLAITAGQTYFAVGLRFDYDIAQLFPKNDPELAFHLETEEKFAFHQPYLVVGIENRDGIFNAGFLHRLDRLTTALAGHELVKAVHGPTTIRNMILTPFGRVDPPFIHVRDSSRYVQDSLRLHAYPDVVGKFLSTRNTAVCLHVQLKDNLSEQTGETLRIFLEEQMAREAFDQYHLYGDAFVKDTYLEELKAELYGLSGLSLLLIFVILFVTFRSVWGIVIPLIIVILSMVWTLGTMGLAGVSINLMTVLIPTLISVIALSDVIHVMSRFREQPWGVLEKRDAIALAVRDIRLALLLTSVTTGLGFLTLTYSSIQPFIEFGLFTAVGVIYAFLLAVFFLPLLIYWLPIVRSRETQPRFSRLIAAAYRFTHRRKGWILAATVLIVLASVAGIARVRINAYLYEELSAKDAFSQTLRFFEEHFTGIRTFELYLRTVDTTRTVLDAGILRQMDQLEAYLLQDYGLKESYSVLTQVKRLNRSRQGGAPTQFALPESTQALERLTQLIEQYYDDLGLRSILTRDFRETRIRGKLYDYGSAEIRKRNRRLEAFIETEMDPQLLEARLTGTTLLLDKSNEIITYHLLYGLLFAIAVVSLIMGLLYRSIKVTLIALVPNLLPLLMILAIIGWADMGLKMSTAIIFTIAFGIAVDDTLHFMSRLKSEWRKGRAVEDAIRVTYLSTGKAITITSVVLVLGFGILLFSSFHTTFITGLLVSLALLFALFADLILLPVLLSSFCKGNK